MKFISIVLSILLIFQIIYIIIPKEFQLHFIDVGQGDSTLIITPENKKILIDGGNDYNILLEYLLDRKIYKIDYIFISHFDSDHCSGLIDVIESIKIKNIIIAKQPEITEELKNILETAKKNKIKLQYVSNGNRVNIDKNTYIDIIYPNANLQYEDLNNNSLVFILNYNSFKVLFTGDIEEAVEKELVKNNKNLQSTILKISHHGSNTSTSDEFLQKVNPRIVLIGVGKNNGYGHPSNDVINRLNKRKIDIYRTDKNGEIIIKTDKNAKIKIKTMYK